MSKKQCMICSHLLNGSELFRAYFLKEEEISWKFVCIDNSEHTPDDFQIISMNVLLEKFPEVKTLIERKPDKSVMLQKGRNSGKWYDFIIQ